MYEYWVLEVSLGKEDFMFYTPHHLEYLNTGMLEYWKSDDVTLFGATGWMQV